MFFFFLSKSQDGLAIYRRNARGAWNADFTPTYLKGWIYVWMNDFVRTEISWMHRWPDFLTHGSPLRAQTRELRENFCHLACERLRQKLFLRKKRCLCFTRLGGMAYILYKKLNYKILQAQTSSVRVSRTLIINLNEIVFFKYQATTKRPYHIFGGSRRE